MKIGKVSENVLKRSVLRQIKTKRKEVLIGAGVGADCAIFALHGGAPMASCVQTAAVQRTQQKSDMPFSIPLGHLIQRCINNLATSGARGMAVQLAFMLPEDIEEPEIKALMVEAEGKCKELDIQLAGGQTCVSQAVRCPVATVTGYGSPLTAENPEDRKIVSRVSPGQDVVVSKWIGLEGTAILAERAREKLLQRYPVYLVEEAAGFGRYLSVMPEAEIALGFGVSVMHDASEGGIFGALWELAERAGVGLTVDLKKLPLRQETVEVCELCNVNPYELLSGGCLVMMTGDGAGLVSALEAAGIPAVVVGRTTDSNDRIIMNEEEVRYMDRPKQDEIYRWFYERRRDNEK